jgi:hypothetical protein
MLTHNCCISSLLPFGKRYINRFCFGKLRIRRVKQSSSKTSCKNRLDYFVTTLLAMTGWYGLQIRASMCVSEPLLPQAFIVSVSEHHLPQPPPKGDNS